MRSDFELLDAWRAGDTKAGSELFERHFDRLYEFLRHKVGDDARELIQKTLLACVESRDRVRDRAGFRGFLFGVARNQLLHYWRSRRRSPALDFGVTSIHDLGPSPRSHASEREEQRLVREAMRRLTVDQQIALELFYWEDLTGPEIAAALDIPEGTARIRLRKARQALEKQLRALATSERLASSVVDGLEAWTRSLIDRAADPR